MLLIRRPPVAQLLRLISSTVLVLGSRHLRRRGRGVGNWCWHRTIRRLSDLVGIMVLGPDCPVSREDFYEKL